VIANVGLNQIIALSIPILMFIYPLAMTLIILGILDPIIKDKPEVYRFTTYFTMIVSVFDGLNSLPSHIKDTSLIKVLLNFATDYLPLFNIGMSWIIFAVVGFIFGWLLNKKREHA
jgi:LIVCS family branched-chain amino acid:cation transporter